jgi:hypothetical protein
VTVGNNEHGLLNALGQLIPPLVESEFGRRDLCILSTRIAIEVAARFHVLLRPLPVQLCAFNPAMVARINLANRMPRDLDETHRWCQNGAWGVGIGYGHTNRRMPEGFDGHLVAVSQQWFLDSALKQVERPARDLYVDPYAVLPVDALRLRKPHCHVTPRGVVLLYMAAPDRIAFLQARDWLERSRRKRLIDELVTKVGAVE